METRKAFTTRCSWWVQLGLSEPPTLPPACALSLRAISRALLTVLAPGSLDDRLLPAASEEGERTAKKYRDEEEGSHRGRSCVISPAKHRLILRPTLSYHERLVGRDPGGKSQHYRGGPKKRTDRAPSGHLRAPRRVRWRNDGGIFGRSTSGTTAARFWRCCRT